MVQGNIACGDITHVDTVAEKQHRRYVHRGTRLVGVSGVVFNSRAFREQVPGEDAEGSHVKCKEAPGYT